LGVGVAAAAWSLPQVVAVAQVPVPGGVCTAPLKSTTLPFLKNVKCDSACVQGGVNYVTFLDDSTGGISVAFTPRVVAPTGTNGCSAPSIGDPNNPTNDPNAGAPYKITTSGIFTGYTCFIQSMLLKNQGLIAATELGFTPVVKANDSSSCNDQVLAFNLVCCPNPSFHPR